MMSTRQIRAPVSQPKVATGSVAAEFSSPRCLLDCIRMLPTCLVDVVTRVRRYSLIAQIVRLDHWWGGNMMIRTHNQTRSGLYYLHASKQLVGVETSMRCSAVCPNLRRSTIVRTAAAGMVALFASTTVNKYDHTRSMTHTGHKDQGQQPSVHHGYRWCTLSASSHAAHMDKRLAHGKRYNCTLRLACKFSSLRANAPMHYNGINTTKHLKVEWEREANDEGIYTLARS